MSDSREDKLTIGNRRYVDWGEELDLNQPHVRERLEALDALIIDVENRTGQRFSDRIHINGEYGYAVQPSADAGKPGRLYVGTHGWADGNFELSEGILLHEAGHNATRNTIYLKLLEQPVAMLNVLDGAEHFMRTDPNRANAWMIEHFGSIDQAREAFALMQHAADSIAPEINALQGKTDKEIFRILQSDSGYLERAAAALDMDALTRVYMDEHFNFSGIMQDLAFQDRIQRHHAEPLLRNLYPDMADEILEQHALRAYDDAPAPQKAFHQLEAVLAPYKDAGPTLGALIATTTRAEEYLVDHFALRHTTNPEAYFSSLAAIEHAEKEGRETMKLMAGQHDVDLSSHPLISDRIALGREHVAAMALPQHHHATHTLGMAPQLHQQQQARVVGWEGVRVVPHPPVDNAPPPFDPPQRAEIEGDKIWRTRPVSDRALITAPDEVMPGPVEAEPSPRAGMPTAPEASAHAQYMAMQLKPENQMTPQDWAKFAEAVAPPPVERLGPIIDKGLPYLTDEPRDARLPEHLLKPAPQLTQSIAPRETMQQGTEAPPAVADDGMPHAPVPHGSNMEMLKRAGLGGYGVGAVIRGGVAYLNNADGGTVTKEAGLGLADALIPGASTGFSGITGTNGISNGVDRVLNAGDTATGTVATGSVLAAPVTGGGSLVMAGIAGLGNLGVNLLHDVAYATGLSNEGGLVVNSKQLALGLLDIAATKQELAQRKEDVPLVVVEKFLASVPMETDSATKDTLFNQFVTARKEAGDDVAAQQDAARAYLAQGGTLATAQAALTGDYETLLRNEVRNVIAVVPADGINGTSKGGFVAEPHLQNMATLRAQFVAGGSSDGALQQALEKEAAAYIQVGGNAEKAAQAYYQRGPGIDTETLAGLKDASFAPILEATVGKKDSYTPGDVMTAAARLGAELARMDTNHDARVSLEELNDGFERPQDFQPTSTRINVIR